MLGNTLNLGHLKNNGLLAFGLGGKYFENALAIGHYLICKTPLFFGLCKFRYLSCPKIFVTTFTVTSGGQNVSLTARQRNFHSLEVTCQVGFSKYDF
jgi:hypothetical protein